MLPIPNLGLLQGETVIVERREETGKGRGGEPVYSDWKPETVDNVLVTPGNTSDVLDSNRPHGVEVKWILGFPKNYPATLRGARIRVRGQEPCFVVGDPQHSTEANTPGPWSLTVYVEDIRG